MTGMIKSSSQVWPRLPLPFLAVSCESLLEGIMASSKFEALKSWEGTCPILFARVRCMWKHEGTWPLEVTP